MEFSFTKEIEDRLLAPLPTCLVAVEKLLLAIMRALVAAALMFPIGALVLGFGAVELRRRTAADRQPCCSAAGSAAAIGLVHRHAGSAQPDQHHVRGDPDAADVHRRHPVPVAVARLDALVSDRDRCSTR